MDINYSEIRLFESFITSLRLLNEGEKELFYLKKGRVTTTHRLAIHLQKELFGSEQTPYFVDLAYPLDFSLIPDLLIHQRDQSNENNLMAFVCRETYLSEKELFRLIDLKERYKIVLTMGCALLPDKDYLLLYRIGEFSVDYYHFNLELATAVFLKRREVENKTRQLRLIRRSR
jgi:hypothetical protein